MKFLKSLVFKRVSFLWIIFITGGFSLTAQAQSTPAFDELKSYFENGYMFEAEFTHLYKDDFTGSEQLTEGRIWIGKNHYKIEGDNQQMVVDGEISRVYDRTKNRVIISEYIEEEDDFAPSRMLQGVDETFTVTETDLEDGHAEIKMVSDDPFSIFTEVTITVDSNRNPLTIEAVDQVDNKLTTTFSSGVFVEETEEPFELDVPDDADIVDLRYES